MKAQGTGALLSWFLTRHASRLAAVIQKRYVPKVYETCGSFQRTRHSRDASTGNERAACACEASDAVTRNPNSEFAAGAGIVADSNPVKEYEECLNKAKSSLKALELAQEVE